MLPASRRCGWSRPARPPCHLGGGRADGFGRHLVARIGGLVLASGWSRRSALFLNPGCRPCRSRPMPLAITWPIPTSRVTSRHFGQRCREGASWG
jgi:hypothetical protein